MTNAAGPAHLADAHALAIGVSRYPRQPHPDVQDAPDVAAALTDPALAGYPPANVPCQPRIGVRMVFALDLTRDTEVDAGLERLARQLRQPPAPDDAS